MGSTLSGTGCGGNPIRRDPNIASPLPGISGPFHDLNIPLKPQLAAVLARVWNDQLTLLDEPFWQNVKGRSRKPLRPQARQNLISELRRSTGLEGVFLRSRGGAYSVNLQKLASNLTTAIEKVFGKRLKDTPLRDLLAEAQCAPGPVWLVVLAYDPFEFLALCRETLASLIDAGSEIYVVHHSTTGNYADGLAPLAIHFCLTETVPPVGILVGVRDMRHRRSAFAIRLVGSEVRSLIVAEGAETDRMFHQAMTTARRPATMESLLTKAGSHETATAAAK